MTLSTLRYTIAFRHHHASWDGMISYFIRVNAPEKVNEVWEELFNELKCK